MNLIPAAGAVSVCVGWVRLCSLVQTGNATVAFYIHLPILHYTCQVFRFCWIQTTGCCFSRITFLYPGFFSGVLVFRVGEAVTQWKMRTLFRKNCMILWA